ncbi:MAG: ADP-ribosylglycohydrolase family protein [Gemmataceae bacterium]
MQSQLTGARAHPPEPRDRFRGCLLGLAVGDALDAPFETLEAADIFARFGLPDAILATAATGPLRYTDDTEMAINLAESLVEVGEIQGDALMRAFAANFDPLRGYGGGAIRIIGAARNGGDWRATSETVYPGGSFGNGAAMRVAPVGLLFHDDPDKVWEQARLSARVTHRHPLGVEGARLLALAVAQAVSAEEIDRKVFLQTLLDRAETEEFRWALRTARKMKRGDSVAPLGNGVAAHQSVVTAIACFLATPPAFDLAVGRAIGLGGDTDTLAAMTGALCGAFGGTGVIPAKLLDRLEVGPKGRGCIIEMADKLFDRFTQRSGLT